MAAGRAAVRGSANVRGPAIDVAALLPALACVRGPAIDDAALVPARLARAHWWPLRRQCAAAGGKQAVRVSSAETASQRDAQWDEQTAGSDTSLPGVSTPGPRSRSHRTCGVHTPQTDTIICARCRCVD
jgi:hypothetical protein